MGRSRLPEDLVQRLLGAMGLDANGTISDLEDALEDLKAQVGQQTFDERLHQLLPEDGKPRPCPRCGRLVRVRAKSVSRTFESLSGTHSFQRNYHYCEHCHAGFFPRDAELGLPGEGDVTLKLESRLLDFAVNSSFEHSAERWGVHYPHRLFSANLFRAVVERVARRAELAEPRTLQQRLAPSPTGRRELLYVLNDGSMVSMQGGLWREAKVGVLVRGENYVSHREAGRGRVLSARYVAVLGEQDEFKAMMRAALDAERWGRFIEVVWLGDGARGNWTLAETLCPGAVQILDPVHAVENGMKCGKALLGEGDVLLEAWQGRLEQLVYAGDVNALVSELMDAFAESETEAQAKAVDSLIGYYRNNASRMDYPRYRGRGLMMGSGIGEAAHRHVLQERMKLSGQHWSETGAHRMASLRAAYRTAGPRRFHAAINEAACVTHLAQVRAERRAACAMKKAA